MLKKKLVRRNRLIHTYTHHVSPASSSEFLAQACCKSSAKSQAKCRRQVQKALWPNANLSAYTDAATSSFLSSGFLQTRVTSRARASHRRCSNHLSCMRASSRVRFLLPLPSGLLIGCRRQTRLQIERRALIERTFQRLHPNFRCAREEESEVSPNKQR